MPKGLYEVPLQPEVGVVGEARRRAPCTFGTAYSTFGSSRSSRDRLRNRAAVLDLSCCEPPGSVRSARVGLLVRLAARPRVPSRYLTITLPGTIARGDGARGSDEERRGPGGPGEGGAVAFGYGPVECTNGGTPHLREVVPSAADVTTAFFPRDEHFMRLALREAERALAHDDVPIGCVIVARRRGVAAAPNERELRGDPTAHAEVLALREAAARSTAGGSGRRPVRDARALRDVRGRDRARAGAARGLRGDRPEGRRRAACSTCSASRGSTTGPRSPPVCWRRSPRRCCATSSPAAR